MKEYHGPAIGDRPWQFDTVCFVDDHIGSGDAESWQQFQRLLQTQSAPVLVEYLASDLNGVSCLPLQTYYTAWTLDRCVPAQTWGAKTATFNFSVNKRIPSRSWMVQCLDQLELKTSHYTKSWPDSYLYPRRMWVGNDQTDTQGYVKNGSLGNLSIFESWLRQHVYEPTVISLICEPVWDQPAAFISEKTVFAVESGTIPIWCGGWGIADTMQELGFDVFADIVDHSYQHEPDAFQRVRLALDLNQDLLRDSAGALALSAGVRSRLEHNRQRMRNCDWFYGMVTSATRDMTAQQTHEVYQDLILKRNYEVPNSTQIRPLK